MRIVTLDEIKPLVSIDDAIAAVMSCLRLHSEEQIICPEPMQMLFHGDDGALSADCHVKSAQSNQLEHFVIKIASGFYENIHLGLPVNDGMSLVLSAKTGEPIAILQDHSWLTSMRTAAAGAIAASLRPAAGTVGIIGTGNQAEYQARFICHHLKIKSVTLYGRSSLKAQALCCTLERVGLNVNVCESVRELCHISDVVVTATSSCSPVVTENDVPESLHIVAVGADSPGKIEISPELVAKANIIVTDDHNQCINHGDYGVAVRAGLLKGDEDIPLGSFINKSNITERIEEPGISLVDLTGLGAQDLAMANLVLAKLPGFY